jgi:Uma2 family endonuclease
MTTSDRSHVKLTYRDYLRIPEDGLRHEIIDGEHYVSPAPETYHQRLLARLLVPLVLQIDDRGLGEVYPAPTDVHLSRHDVMQPDIVVVLARHAERITRKKIVGAPDLAIEILSPSTGRRDRGIKMRRYARAGINEYWVVDPVEKRVEQYVLTRRSYRMTGRHTERIALVSLPDVVVDLAKIW